MKANKTDGNIVEAEEFIPIKVDNELKPCACGCEDLTRHRFISGHNTRIANKESRYKIGLKNKGKLKGRVPWNKGLKGFGDEWREKIILELHQRKKDKLQKTLSAMKAGAFRKKYPDGLGNLLRTIPELQVALLKG